ncbi:MAG: hypothetical protein AB7G21_04490 [Dehalococcoidia bacterium]
MVFKIFGRRGGDTADAPPTLAELEAESAERHEARRRMITDVSRVRSEDRQGADGFDENERRLRELEALIARERPRYERERIAALDEPLAFPLPPLAEFNPAITELSERAADLEGTIARLAEQIAKARAESGDMPREQARAVAPLEQKQAQVRADLASVRLEISRASKQASAARLDRIGPAYRELVGEAAASIASRYEAELTLLRVQQQIADDGGNPPGRVPTDGLDPHLRWLRGLVNDGLLDVESLPPATRHFVLTLGGGWFR